MRYLSLKEVIALHKFSAKQAGGFVGIRDIGLLQSAITQPKARFSGRDLYPSLAEKAAALAFFLVKNHPFLDGNKRTSLVVAELFLELNGHALTASDEDCVTTFLSLAAGELTEEELANWIAAHSAPSR